MLLTIGVSARFFCLISKTSPRIAKANFHQTLVQGKLIRIWCQGFHPLCGIQRSPDWLISRALHWLSCRKHSHSFLSTIRFAGSLDVPESRQIKTFTIDLWHKTLGFRTHWTDCLEATRGRSNWKMVSVRFFCFQLFNYRNPLHQIAHSSFYAQGSKSRDGNEACPIER